MQIRILLALFLVAAMAVIGSAQTWKPTGASCNDGYGPEYALYASVDDLRCCLQMPDLSVASDSVQCAENCVASGYDDSIFGYYRNGTYDSCVCLQCYYGSTSLDSSLQSLPSVGYTSGNTATSYVRDLIAGSSFDFEVDLQSNSTGQVTLSLNQTAVIRTDTLVNGNMIQFLAVPTVTGVSSGTIFGFTLRELIDYGTSTQSVVFRNNSFEISNLAQRYIPAVQYKRQVSSSAVFVYTMKNLGNELMVVLSSDNEPVTSWIYSPIASNTAPTIMTLSNNFIFTLDFESSSSMAYTSCYNTQCDASTKILSVCENQALVEQQYCYLGCGSYPYQNECVQCNATTCKGTCSSNSTCVCSETQIGQRCQVDLSTSTFRLRGSTYQSGETPVSITTQFDFANCTVGQVCGTISHSTPTSNYMIVTLSGSCCTATLRLAEMQRDVNQENAMTLRFVRVEPDWSCSQGDLAIDPQGLDSEYPLNVRSSSSGGYNPYNPYNNYDSTYDLVWQWAHGDMMSSPGMEDAKCDSSIAREINPSRLIAEKAMAVGVTFVVVCCVAVAAGFVGGFFMPPRRLTIKKRGYKGCLPKSTKIFSRSIIAIVSVDVAVTTIMNLIGALIPISGLVLLSGIFLAIMVFQFESVASHFRGIRRVHQMRVIQRVFGRFSAAFLIILGFFLIFSEIVGLAGGMLAFIAPIFMGIVGWLYLALYVIWVFVAVHFAGAIYISVCYYYTASQTQTDEQESKTDSEDEKEELKDRRSSKSGNSTEP